MSNLLSNSGSLQRPWMKTSAVYISLMVSISPTFRNTTLTFTSLCKYTVKTPTGTCITGLIIIVIIIIETFVQHKINGGSSNVLEFKKDSLEIEQSCNTVSSKQGRMTAVAGLLV